MQTFMCNVPLVVNTSSQNQKHKATNMVLDGVLDTRVRLSGYPSPPSPLPFPSIL
jgi:hypothetical protein